MLYFDRTGGRSLGQTRMTRTRPRGRFDIPWQTGQSTKPNLHPALFSTLRIQPSTQSTTNSIKYGHSFRIKNKNKNKPAFEMKTLFKASETNRCSYLDLLY